MDVLDKNLNEQIAKLSDKKRKGLLDSLETLSSLYPFNQYEYIIANLLGQKKISLSDYNSLRDEYTKRNANLYLYKISAPRRFGEEWAHGHLQELVPALQTVTNEIDPNYTGQYDLIMDNEIRIEVRASRAVESNNKKPLYQKALPLGTDTPFRMNYQQIKPYCCDVFVWLAVWRDKISYWMLASKEVESHASYSSGQHYGNVGEGQLHITNRNIRQFDKYLASPDNLEDAIKNAHIRQKGKAN
ncbi:MAG: hypothetical protein PHC50_00280 [Candidatus Cloacimonetes bacterium]|nr:hypothetical protein [Candidatus Cloacimonadota bacterium]